MDSYAMPSMHLLYQEAGFGAAGSRSKGKRTAKQQKSVSEKEIQREANTAATEPPTTSPLAVTTQAGKDGPSHAEMMNMAIGNRGRTFDGRQENSAAEAQQGQGRGVTGGMGAGGGSASGSASGSARARRLLNLAAPPLTPFVLDSDDTTASSPATTRRFINANANKPLPAFPPAHQHAAGATSGTAADVNAGTDIDPTLRLGTSATWTSGLTPTSEPASPLFSSSSPAPPTTPGPRRRGRAYSWSRLAKNGQHPSVSLLSSPPPPPPIRINPGYLAPCRPHLLHHAAMVSDPTQRSSSSTNPYHTAKHANSAAIMTSSENPLPSSSHESSLSASASAKQRAATPKPLIVRNGRTYIHEENLSYPLPVDLTELHRQSLRTLLLFQLFGGPIISNAFSTKPPQRILEVGCGSGFWSMMCHRYFAQHGYSSISFTGMDIVPLCGTGPDPNSKPDKDMNWRYMQHDMRRTPWPFQDSEFDLVMVKDMSSSSPAQFIQDFMDEYLRVLRPGGVLEIWETDLAIRMLRPHVPVASSSSSSGPAPSEDSNSESDDEDDASRLGAYVVTANTPLSAPLNPFLVEYNGWLSKALDKRYISAVPCTLIGPMLLQEDGLLEVRSKRLAIPLSEVRWEREGVGGVVTKDGKSYIDSMAMKGKGKAADPKAGKTGKSLTAAQAAIRRTALETSVALIQALEPMLRDTSGKSQDEWDGWTGKMMNDLLKEGGTSWGECLEIGAWSARKRSK
jgi:ubiquinone/menaquinone biosynthesis C-methylase UbiE